MAKLSDEQYKQIGIIAVDLITTNRKVNRAFSLSKYANTLNHIIQNGAIEIPKKRNWFKRLIDKIWN
jgi:hypothetical protein